MIIIDRTGARVADASGFINPACPGVARGEPTLTEMTDAEVAAAAAREAAHVGRVRLAALAAIDAAAEAARLRFITGGAGQALTYESKRREADRWQAAVDAGGSPDPAAFPLIKGRADRLGVAAQAVADEWLGKAAAWTAVAAAIEDTREAAKEAAAAAGTVAEIDAVLAALTWPAPE